MLGFEKVQIRAMRHDDEPHLFALAEECASGHLAADETVGALSRCEVFVAEHDDEVAGYVALAEDGGTVRIRQLLVATGHTERKVGDQLCDWAEGYAVSHGCQRMRVEAGGQDQPAQAFYQARGYVMVEDGCLELRLPSLANAID
jgi:ribosomal protein S18 acetylase RimI-like enzyme